MRFAITPNLMANGNITPSSFAKVDPSNDEYAIQCVAGDQPIGVTGSSTDAFPVAGGTAEQAVAGENVIIYGPGSIVELTAGTGGWTRGNLLKSDTNGNGVPSTSAADKVGAYAFESVSAGEVGRVMVLPPAQSTAAEAVSTVTASGALTTLQSGQTFVVNAADTVQTLPMAAAGLRYRFLVTTTGAGGATGTTIAVQAGDKMHYHGITAAAGKGVVNTQATAADGDFVWVIGNGVDGWNIIGIGGTWARVA